MVDIVSFAEVCSEIEGYNKRHLLLGNGFSIALRPDIFTYDSLYDNADFSKSPHITRLFDALGTRDFEQVIKHLQSAAVVVEVYRPSLVRLAASLRRDAALVKDALVSAIARRHPDRPYDITDDQYEACRAFLGYFDHMFTLNYDVLLYWSLMQQEVDGIDLRPDDGFRHPEDDPDKPYVSWLQANSPTVHYLHGALHLFDAGSEIIKYTWSKTDVPIVDQIRKALDEDKFPLFVAEGTSGEKRDRILHNAYLHKALRSFEGCTRSPRAAIVVFGHSLAENDAHVLRCIAKGSTPYLAVSIYGDPASDMNKEAIANAESLVARRKAHNPRKDLKLVFFDAASAQVWG